MIFGIGVDTVALRRFARSLERTPALRARLFVHAELVISGRADADTGAGAAAKPAAFRSLASLAARFAAKEAMIKALGDSHGLSWHDLVVTQNEDRAPSFARTEKLTRVFQRIGAGRAHLSMTHDADQATAFVVVECV